jgi:hypothetical protein
MNDSSFRVERFQKSNRNDKQRQPGELIAKEMELSAVQTGIAR